MWERAELKAKAKLALKGTYWKAFGVSIILGFAGGGYANGGGGNLSNAINENMSPELLSIALAAILLFLVLSSLIRIFAGYHLEVGCQRYFVAATSGEADFSLVFSGFGNGGYWPIIKAMIYRAFITFLWTLLLIIPGIIKTFQYLFVPYILADNPAVGSKRALEISKHMTDGHKMSIFVLGLSFLGWFILGALALLIGIAFVYPYQNATFAELYVVLRNEAIKNHHTTHGELNLDSTETPYTRENTYSYFDHDQQNDTTYTDRD